MAINVIDNGDTALSVRNDVNNNFAEVVTVADALALTTSAVSARVDTLEGNYIDRTYDYSVATAITVTNDVYEEVAVLLTTSRPTGTYELKLSMIYSLNSVIASAYFRFSLDGGSTWTEMRKEPKDNTDNTLISFVIPDSHTVGIKDIQVQARKETSGDVLLIDVLNIIYERKL